MSLLREEKRKKPNSLEVFIVYALPLGIIGGMTGFVFIAILMWFISPDISSVMFDSLVIDSKGINLATLYRIWVVSTIVTFFIVYAHQQDKLNQQ
jgi:hypothetical protein